MNPVQEDEFKIENVQLLPVKNRKKTDFFCTIFLSIYVILLALILLFVYNQDNLNRITYPTDNQGTLCGYDAPDFPYVYYTSYTDPTKRLCVNACPTANQTTLSCKPTNTLGCNANNNSKYEVIIYNSYLDEGKIGLFCLPTDSIMKNIILDLSNTAKKYRIHQVMDAFWTCAWISAILGPLLFLLTHFQPYKMVPWVIFIGGIFSIVFAVFMLMFTGGYLMVKIFLSVVFLGLGIVSLKTMADQDRRDAVVICSRLVHAAALTHSSQDNNHKIQFSLANLSKLIKPLLLILSFIFVYFLFFYINIREVLSVWSVGRLVFEPDKPFYTVVGFGSNFLMVLVGLQLIWGAFFIKEAFNFIAGCHAVYWFFTQTGQPSYLESTELLLRYHWGSVVGGSLLQGFFYFFDLVFDFFFSQDSPQKPIKDSYGKYMQKPYLYPIDYDRVTDNSNDHPIKDFFNLIRGEALSYVALMNQPYCVASRHCEFLSSNSRFYSYSQITNRIFRVNMHIVPIFIVLCVSMGEMGHAATPYAILIISVLCFFIITYFLGYHAEKTQGLLICTYVDEALNDGELVKAPKVMQIMYEEDIKHIHSNCSLGTLLCNEAAFAIN